MKGRLFIGSIGDKVWLRVENDKAEIVCEVDITHENFSMALVGPSSQEADIELYPDNDEEE